MKAAELIGNEEGPVNLVALERVNEGAPCLFGIIIVLEIIDNDGSADQEGGASKDEPPRVVDGTRDKEVVPRLSPSSMIQPRNSVTMES